MNNDYGFGLSEGGGASIPFPERSVGVGLDEEGRVPSSGYPSESRYGTSGRYPPKMEVGGVLKDLDLSLGAKTLFGGAVIPSSRQIGGNHYKDMPIQPSEYITKNGLGWYEGNCIKYVTRYRTKGGRQDIEKAIHYLELLLETLD